MARDKWVQIRVSEQEKKLLDDLRRKFDRELTYTELFWVAIDLLRQEVGDKQNINMLDLRRQKALVARVDMERIERLFDMLGEGIEKNRMELREMKQRLMIDQETMNKTKLIYDSLKLAEKIMKERPGSVDEARMLAPDALVLQRALNQLKKDGKIRLRGKKIHYLS